VTMPTADDTARSSTTSARPAGPFAGVAFDLDGTLVNTLPAMELSWNAILAPVIGRAIPAQEIVGTLGPHLIEIVRGYEPDDAEALTAALAAHYRSIFLTTSELYDGIVELVTGLADRGVALGVVTSMDAGARPLLEHLGLLQHFSTVVTCDDVAHLKPHPEPVLAVAAGLGVAPAELLVVGDSPVDMVAARAAGAVGGAALWGFSGRKAESEAAWLFDTPVDVHHAWTRR
jgi:2-phosphoglycolate phosphatase